MYTLRANPTTTNVGIGVSNIADNNFKLHIQDHNRSGILLVNDGNRSLNSIEVQGQGVKFFTTYMGDASYAGQVRIAAKLSNGTNGNALTLNTNKDIRLQVDGTSYSQQMLIGSSSLTYAGSNVLYTNGNATITGNLSTGNLNAGSWMYIGSSSEDNPRLALHHAGTAHPHAYIDFMENLNFRANKSWISPLILYADGTVGIGFTTTYNSGELKPLGSSGTNNDKLAIKGDVSIVDNDHQRQIKLHQDGTIKAREVHVMVASDQIPDYVFKEGYELMGLNDLKQYINDNGHLPKVPSAEEFGERGEMNLGEMDNLLLEKVEELTLYILQLQERIAELESGE
jgi:Uri superfamily endonuclease